MTVRAAAYVQAMKIILGLRITGSLADGEVDTAYSQTLTVEGGTGPYTWTLSAGSFPDGLDYGTPSGNTVDVEGTPTTEESQTITVHVEDSTGLTASQEFTVNIHAAPVATLDYVYATDYGHNVFRVIDVSDTANPSIVGSYATTGSNNTCVARTGTTAFYTSFSTDKLTSVDVSDPANPVELQSFPCGSNPFDVVIDEANQVAFVGCQGGNQIRAVDISDPSNMADLGQITITTPEKMQLVGSYLFLAAAGGGWSGTFRVIDVSDPTTMSQVYSTSTQNTGGAKSVRVDGDFAYVCATNQDRLGIWDVSDPTSPVFQGAVADGTNLNGVQDVAIIGTYAFCVNANTDKLTVVDVSDPTSPAFDNALTDALFHVGRSIWPFGNNLYIGTDASGIGDNADFSIVDASDPTSPSILGSMANFSGGMKGISI